MAFFDDIGKAFSNASQKTKNMADAAKLNSSISDEERKLTALYAQIGSLYVQLHSEDCEESFADLVCSCKESCQKIDDMKKKVKELRNIISCPGCGADISGDAAFCSICGYRMPPKSVPASQAAVKCTSCGATITSGMNFCTVCGAPKPQPATVQSAPPQPAVATCPSCNAQIEHGSAFCVVCGAPVRGTAPSAVPTPAEAPVSAPAEEPAPAVIPEPTPVEMPVPEPEKAFEAEEVSAPLSAAIICPNCGTTLDYESVFCVECGTKVR